MRYKEIISITAFLFLIALSSTAYAATSIELTTEDWINVFGNLNLTYRNLVNAGNVSIRGNLSVDSNLSVDTNTLFVDAENNRVGIGTTSPANLLHLSSASTPTTLAIESTAVDSFPTLNLTNDARTWLLQIQGTSGDRFGIRDSTAALTRLSIDSSGNLSVDDTTFNVDAVNNRVGIGTTSPGAALDVRGGITLDAEGQANMIIDAGGATGADDDSQLIFRNQGNNRAIIQYDFENTRLDFQVGGAGATERMTILDGGNVGIGTTAPTAKLHVEGTANISSNFIVQGSIRFDDLAVDPEDRRWEIRHDTSNWRLIAFDSGLSSSNVMVVSRSGTTINSTTFPNGNVGIGTTTPTERLVVAGNVNITGTLFVGNLTLRENGSLYMPVYGTDDKLVLYLPFSEGNTSTSNTTTKDRSPYGNDGQCYGTSFIDGCNWTSGKYGNAIFLDGTNDYITIPNSNAFQFGDGDFAISIWVNRADDGDNDDRVLNFENSPGNQGWYLRTRTTVGASGALQPYFAINTPSVTSISSNKNMSANEWHYIVVTRNGGTLRMYIDTEQVASTSISGAMSSAYTGQFSIGTNIGGNTQFTKGTIDEVMIYKRALAPEEIRTHYLRGKGFGASGAITADKFRIVNTSARKQLELNQTAFSVTNTSGDDGLFYVDKINQRVGIGLTNPTAKLHVNEGNLYVIKSTGSDTEINVGENLGAKDFGALGWNIAGNFLWLDADSSVGDRHLSLQSGTRGTGNVGINTTVPANTLTVQGTLNVTTQPTRSGDLFVASSGRVGIGTTAATGSMLTIIGGSNNFVLNLSSSNSQITLHDADDSGMIRISTGDYDSDNSDTDLAILTGAGPSNERMVITNGGNIGIGTTTPTELLVVAGNANVTGNLIVGADGSGNLGIGTTSPADLLHVSSSSAAEDVRIRISTTSSNSNRASMIRFTNFGGNFSQIYYTQHNYSVGTGNALVITNIANSSIIFNTKDVEKMRIDALGNVGIGTTTPNATLDVRGTGIFSTGFVNFTNNTAFNQTLYVVDGNVGIGTTSPLNTLHVEKSVNDDYLVKLNNTGPTSGASVLLLSTTLTGSGTKVLDAKSGSTQLFLVRADGNVGIGTTAPLNTLHVNGSGAQGGFRVTNESGTNVFFVNSTSGNVGIGTTAPNSKLAVSGDISFEGNIGDYTGLSQPTIYRTSGNGASYPFNSIDNMILQIRSDVARDFIFAVGSSPKMVVKGSGNVGIGTTSPGYKLVVDSGRINVSRGNAGVTPDANTVLLVEDDAAAYISIATPNNVAGSILFADPQDGDVGYIQYNHNVNDMRFAVNAAERMTITSAGRVGIGTTSPRTIFEISTTGAAVSTYQAGAGQLFAFEFRNGTGTASNNRTGYFQYRMDTTPYRYEWATTNTAGTEDVRMVLDQNGNVGIGTTSPLQTLTVAGTLNVTGSTTGEGTLYVDSSSNVGIGRIPDVKFHVLNNDARIARFQAISPATGGVWDIRVEPDLVLQGETIVNQSFKIRTYDGGEYKTLLIINGTTGNVGMGINTSNPNYLLQVASGTDGRSVNLSNVLFVNGTSGNVGIGTAAPQEDFELFRAAGDNPTLYLSDGDVAHGMTTVIPTNVGGRFVMANLEGGHGGLEVTGYSTVGSALVLRGFVGSTDPTDTEGAVVIEGRKRSGTTVQNMGNSETILNVRNGLTGSLMALLGSGNLGIGTTNPLATLHVNGTTILQGLINSTDTQPRTIVNFTNSTSGTVCYIDISGNLVCAGTKSALIDTSFDSRKLYAVESPDVRHIDEGRAKLRKGFANVSIDPIFKETIENDYNVYLTPEGKTKALYVDEKARDYFIVKDTAATNAVFSYIISAYRKGYASKRFDSGSDLEITATIDDENEITEVIIGTPLEPLASSSPLQESLSPLEAQIDLNSSNQAQSAPETQQSTSQDNSTSAISGAQETTQNTSSENTTLAISGAQETNQTSSQTQQPSSQSQQPNSVAGTASITANAIKRISNKMTGKVISEIGLETDLSKILDNSSTLDNDSTNDATSVTETAAESSTTDIAQNNSTNETTTNQTLNNATSATETEEQDNEKMTITDTTNKHISKASENNVFEISENKFIIYTADEDEIIEKIQEKTKLSKDKIKGSIKFKKKEVEKDEFEEEVEEEKATITQTITELGYITKVNGSVIIRLG